MEVEQKEPIEETYKVDVLAMSRCMSFKSFQEQKITLVLDNKEQHFELLVRDAILHYKGGFKDGGVDVEIVHVEVYCEQLTELLNRGIDQGPPLRFKKEMRFTHKEWEELDKASFLSILYQVAASAIGHGRRAGGMAMRLKLLDALGIGLGRKGLVLAHMP